MKIVLNTHSDNMGSKVWIYDFHKALLQYGIDASLNDWDNYSKYDVAVFLGYDYDIETARRQNPKIKICIADPKEKNPIDFNAARQADVLIVSSIEQRDRFFRLTKNILVYYPFPDMETVEKSHINGEFTTIGYHGNRVHLECMLNQSQLAIEEFAKTRNTKFMAMYNVDELGRAFIGLPDEKLVKTEHIQWSYDNYFNELAKADIGIVPNFIPIRNKQKILRKSEYKLPEFVNEPYDHLLRFKTSSNPGRIYTFAKLGIPVVADFFPSAVQFITDGKSGYLASSPESWYYAIEELAKSPEKRNSMAKQLLIRCEELANPEGKVKEFLYLIESDFKNTNTFIIPEKSISVIYLKYKHFKQIISSSIQRRLKS